MRLSNANLEVIRKRPQSTKLYMSIFEPQIVFQARVDGAISKGERVIPYDSVSLGSYTAIVPNATMWIGTSAGANDIGKIRIRSATSSEITVSENENIEWADNLYLTVFYYVELWPVYPRIINNPSNVEDVIFYKDYDIPYTNQNSILGTFLCMGPHRAGWTSESQYYSSTGTHNLLGSSLSYNWTFEGGTPSSSTSANPGLVTYNTPGHYVTRLQISGSNGAIDTSYRYVSIYDRIGQGSNTPILRWEVSNIGGSRDEGGYKATFKVYDNVDIQENAIVILFSDDWYGDSHQSFGGNYPNAEKIFFVGHIMEDSIHYDYQHSFVEFTVASLTQLMKESLGFSVSVESVATPDVWYELLDMDCRRAIYHYLRWHTTALQLGDFQFVGDDRKIQFFDADRASMYDAIDNLMRDTLIGKCVSDRQGKTWMEVDAKAYPDPTGTFPSVMDITKRDWMLEPVIDERLSDSLSYLEYGGIAYSGVVTGTFSAILASAPGNTPSFRGKIETHEGLALLGQDQLNQMVGNVWANENSPYPKITMEMANSLRNLDIAPQETTNVSISPTDTARGILIQGLYMPNGMDWKYDSKNSLLLPRIDFKNLVNGAEGQTIIIADSEEIENGFNVPGLQIPPLAPLAFPPFAIPTGTLGGIITQEIIQFQSDYRSYQYPFSNTGRGIIYNGAVGIPNSAAITVTFQTAQAGVYLLSAHISCRANFAGGNAQLSIGTGGGAVAIAEAEGTDANDVVNVACTVIVSMAGGQQFNLGFNGSGGLGWTTSSLGFSAFRISA